MFPKVDVSIIIPVYQRIEWIGKCIESLMGQSFEGSFEVIIVDDGSPNETEMKSAIEEIPVPCHHTIRYIKNSHGGPAATRNKGVRASAGRIVCFIDDDSIADRNWLGEIIKPFCADDSVALVSGKTLSFERVLSFPLLLEKSVYSGKSWATCNIAYRRDAFDALGGFDESFVEPSWEDNDLGLRAGWAGYVHIYNERAVIYHPHERTVEEYKKKCLLNGRGAAVFSRKYLFKKPLWGIGTPFAVARRLIYLFSPNVWLKHTESSAYLKFLWSFYSLKGFIGEVKRDKHGEN